MAITRLGPNQSVNLASNVTGTLPTANGGTGATSFSPGKVLQVVQGSHSTQASTTSTSFQDVSTNTNVSMTCSATSSKVLILAHFNELYYSGTTSHLLRVTAGGTEIMRTNNALYFPSLGGEKLLNQDMIFLYSPSSTSSIEYKLQFCSQNSTEVRVSQNSNPTTSIILMEIGA